MKWSEKYATGVHRVDEQHKMLFTMAADFRCSLDEGDGERSYAALLSFFEAYTAGHFRFEERCMREHRCPAAQQNKDEHATFLLLLEGYREHYSANGYLAEKALELIDTVDEWLDSHICQVDIHLRSCVNA